MSVPSIKDLREANKFLAEERERLLDRAEQIVKTIAANERWIADMQARLRRGKADAQAGTEAH